jgi:hypothetical protein
MVKIIDTNKHGVRREIDHQYKKGKKNALSKKVHRKRKEAFNAKEENKEENKAG